MALTGGDFIFVKNSSALRAYKGWEEPGRVKVVALAGGTGGAKLAAGCSRSSPAGT